MEHNTNTPGLITIAEALVILHCSRETLYKFINSSQLKTVKVGRRRYTTERFINELVATLEATAA